MTERKELLRRAWRRVRGPSVEDFDRCRAALDQAHRAVEKWEAVQRARQRSDAWLAAYLAWRESGDDECGEYGVDWARARDLRPGQTVSNPNVGWQGDDREVLDVVSISVPDEDGMVTIFCLVGPPVRIVNDWGMEILTGADLDLRASLLMDEAERLGDAPGGGEQS